MEDRDRESRSSMEETDKKAVVREEMVATAVRFLENPRVQSSSEKTKREFLQKKGLTEDEIILAFNRVVVKPEATVPRTEAEYLAVPTRPQVVASPQSGSISSKVRDLLNLLLLIGGVSYGVRYLWKKYISPWLFGSVKPGKSTQAVVLETCQSLLTSVQQLQEAVTGLQESIKNQTDRLQLVTASQQDGMVNGGNLKDLKSELQSVKGILLSSRSFPQQPSLSLPTIPSIPSIPAWQLQSHQQDTVDVIKDAVTGTEDTGSGKEELQSNNTSSSSEMEMINSGSSPEMSGEEGHHQ